MEELAPHPPPLRTEEGGVVRVGKTRVSLDTVIGAFHQGCSAEQIVLKFPTLELTDVYAAREDPEPGVSGRLVADAVPGGARYVPLAADVPLAVAAIARPGDLVLTMGAGDVTRLGPLILAELGAAPR